VNETHPVFTHDDTDNIMGCQQSLLSTESSQSEPPLGQPFVYEDYITTHAQKKAKQRIAQDVLKHLDAITLELDAKALLKSLNTDEDFDENVTCQECLVCMAPYSKGDTVVSLSCGHSYHSNCIHEWFLRQCHCPYCRHDVKAEYDEHVAKQKTERWARGFLVRDTVGAAAPTGSGGGPMTAWRLAKFLMSEDETNNNNRDDGYSSSSLLRIPQEQSAQLIRHWHQHRLARHCQRHCQQHQKQRQRSKRCLFVHVLQTQQDAIKHEMHQRTVLHQLSFSPMMTGDVAY
jgi:Ring finger domain